MDVWIKINVKNQANRQSLFLIIQTYSIQPQKRVHNSQASEYSLKISKNLFFWGPG